MIVLIVFIVGLETGQFHVVLALIFTYRKLNLRACVYSLNLAAKKTN